MNSYLHLMQKKGSQGVQFMLCHFPEYLSIHNSYFSFFEVQHPVDQRVGDVRGDFGDSVHPGQGPDPEHVDHRSLVAHGHLPELGR